MNVTTDQILALLGSKEVEIMLLKQQIAALQQRVKELEPESKPE